MRAFWQVVRVSVRQQMTYRTAMTAGLVTNIFFGILRAALLIALYQDQGVVNGMDLQGAIAYVAISQAMIAFLSIFGSLDIARTVYDGSVTADLLKPTHFFIIWMGRDLGRSLVNLFTRGIVFMLIFSLFYSITLPSNPQQGLLFAVSLGICWLVNFFWRMLVNLIAFWSPDIQGFARMAFASSQLFSGFILPLRLMPDWFNKLCQFTPFPGMVNTPIEIYLGISSPNNHLQAIGTQSIWLLVMIGTALFVYNRGIRQLIIQGG